MIDLGRAAVDEQNFENFIDFTKNIVRAAENSQNAPPKHPKGSSWVVLAALGGLGGLLGRLGRLLEHLGGPWVDFCRFKLNKAGWGAALVSIWGPKMGPKGHPKRAKIEDKNEDLKRSF